MSKYYPEKKIYAKGINLDSSIFTVGHIQLSKKMVINKNKSACF